MPLVVDASAVAAIAFDEPEGPGLAAYLSGQTLIAPTILDYELANTAIKKVRRKQGSLAEVTALLTLALRMPIQRLSVSGDEVFILAEETGLSAYDASYLWLARKRDIELVTLDHRLAEVTDALGGPGASYRQPITNSER